MTPSKTIRLVALLEASKGLLALLAAAGLLSLAHENIQTAATKLVEHLHLNPASRYPHIFLDAASHLQDSRLLLIALGSAAYSAVRFVEAYGLFLERTWAEALAAGSGAIYVPFEAVELVLRPTWHGLVLLLLNLGIVAIMVQALLARRRIKKDDDPT